MVFSKVSRQHRLVLFLAALFIMGCGNPFCYEVSGPITQWSYHISPFQKIRVYNAPQIYITQGDSQSVVVESEENMFQALLFHIDPFDQRLFIDFDETCIDGIDHFKIFITVDTLKEIDLRGGGEVFVEDTMRTDSLAILISGDANATVSKLIANQVHGEITGTGDIRLTTLDTLERLSLNFPGIGSYFGYNAHTRNAYVEVSGGALVQTHVTQTLDVDISGTGNVYYRGNPAITQDISGNGQVIDAN